MIPDSVSCPTIVHGDALDTMRAMPDASVNLIVTDPPYFRVKGEAWDRQWDDVASFLDWMRLLALEWRRILVPNGSLYVFASPRMAARVECLIAEQFAVLNHIVWAKPGGTWAAVYGEDRFRTYVEKSERVIFAEHIGVETMAMGDAGYEAQCERLRGEVFEPLRAYLADTWTGAGLSAADLNSATGSQMAGHYLTTVQWALPTADRYALMQAACPALERPWSSLRAECDTLQAEFTARRRVFEDLRRPFTVSSDVPYTDVWTYPVVQGYPGKHPCEKPREMLADIIGASSRPGDVVADFFLGSGVSGEQAVRLGRRFIGVEKGDYVHAARRRIADAVCDPAFATMVNAEAPVGAQLSML